MKRNTLYLIATTLIFSLACGAPAYLAATDIPTPTYRKSDVIMIPSATPKVVTIAPLTVRESPCLPSSKVDYLEAGEVVTPLGAWRYCMDGGAWVLVDGGWVNAKYLDER